jgi:hypothetical protein
MGKFFKKKGKQQAQRCQPQERLAVQLNARDD